MYGTEPRQHFDRFNSDVDYVMEKIFAEVKASAKLETLGNASQMESLKLEDDFPVCSEYYINCSLMPIIKKLSAMETRSNRVGRPEKCGGAVDEDILVAKEAVAGLLHQASEQTANKPYFVIKQPALRDFWVSKFHPILSTSEKRFVVMLQESLVENGASSVLAIDYTNNFCSAISTYLDEVKKFDAHALAAAGRTFPFTQSEFIDVVQYIANSSRIVLLLPPINAREKVIMHAKLINIGRSEYYYFCYGRYTTTQISKNRYAGYFADSVGW